MILGWVLRACFGNFRWPANLCNQYHPGYCSPFPCGTWGEGQSRWERGDNWVYEHIYDSPISIPPGQNCWILWSWAATLPLQHPGGLRGFLEKLVLGIQSLMWLLSTLTPTLPSSPMCFLCSSIVTFQMDLHDSEVSLLGQGLSHLFPGSCCSWDNHLLPPWLEGFSTSPVLKGLQALHVFM